MCHRCLSRRSFLHRGAGAAAAVAGAPLLFSSEELRSFLEWERPDLEVALRAWRWIEASRITTDHGATWPADPMDTSTVGDTLYSHGPGVLPFALELFHATQDEQILDAALRGADHLAGRMDDVQGAGLYVGLGGSAFGLVETYRATRDVRYAQAAARAADLMIERAERVGAGAAWPLRMGAESLESHDIVSGTAGTGLTLIYLADALQHPRSLETAVQAGHRLVELAKPVEGGLTWDMREGYTREMPNFSHGTAGIAYFLATLAVETGEASFRDAAIRGARYVQSIAVPSGDGYVVRHHTPGGEELFYLSWCHGPVGTARLFQRLHELTGDGEWKEWVHRSARGVMATGIPEERTPGFWENVSQCCGTAGVGDFFLTLHRLGGDADYLGFAHRSRSDLLRQARGDGSTTRWVQAENRTQPENLVAQTGFMQGAAGMGKYFLHLDSMSERGAGPTVVLPDAPF